MNRRQKTITFALGAVLAVWVVVLAGYAVARHAKVTKEKVLAQLQAIDLATLHGADREAAIRALADKLNSLPYDERRSVRLSGELNRWFNGLTDEEKGRFLEMTMPTGFKRMITAFEDLPEQKRKKAIEDSYKRIREASAEARDPGKAFLGAERGTNEPVVSDEIRQKVLNIGLGTFFKESSAQTKAEVMPLLEELHRAMQRGAALR